VSVFSWPTRVYWEDTDGGGGRFVSVIGAVRFG